MDLYLIRHGESDANTRNEHTGWEDSFLSERGKEQAAKAGENLKGLHFDRVYVSITKRARETAEIALPGYEYIFTDQIREVSVGSLAGKTVAECEKAMGDFYKERHAKFDFSAWGGESLEQLYIRTGEFLKGLETLPEATVCAAVCHEGAIYGMICYALKADFPRTNIHVENSHYVRLKFVKGKWTLEL